MAYSTTMYELLSAVVDYLKANKSSMDYARNVATIIKGYGTVRLMFPAVIVTPINSTIVRRFSGMKCDIVRKLNIYLYTKELNETKARKQLTGISRDIRESLQPNFFLKDDKAVQRTFGMDVGDMAFTGVRSWETSYLGEAIIPVEFISKVTFSGRTQAVGLGEGTNQSLMNAVEEKFKNNWQSRFPAVRDWVFWQQKVAKGLPAIGVYLVGESTDKSHTGQDTISRNFVARVVSSGTNMDFELQTVCDISEDFMSFVHQYNTWDGTVFDTTCSEITYDFDNEGGLAVFGAEIPFSCLCREKAVSNT